MKRTRDMRSDRLAKPLFQSVLSIAKEQRALPSHTVTCLLYIAGVVARSAGIPKEWVVQRAGDGWDAYDGPVFPENRQDTLN